MLAYIVQAKQDYNQEKGSEKLCQKKKRRFLKQLQPQYLRCLSLISFITEGDLYRLIMKSKLPSAEKFESWVMDEVLPTIRKLGVGVCRVLVLGMLRQIILLGV